MSARYTTEQASKLTIIEHKNPRLTLREAGEKAELERIKASTRAASLQPVRSTQRSVRVRGSRGRSSEPNQTEKAYARRLDALKLMGEISGYWFESIKFRLADRTWFEIDFMVLNKNMEMEMHEVKTAWSKNGEPKVHFEDDAKVKIKVAAELYPFKFVVASYFKKEFTLTEV